MVAISQPQAAQVGLEILHRGGDAIDVVIVIVTALTVVEPTGCGVGGGALTLVWTRGCLHDLDASGRMSGLLDRERVCAVDHERIPLYGQAPAAMSGCPAAQVKLLQRSDRLPFRQLLRPAIELARDGSPISSVVARLWQSGPDKFRVALPQRSELWAWFDEFLIDGRAPRAGKVLRRLGQAGTLDELARSQCEGFYRGKLVRTIAGHIEHSGGYPYVEDLAGYQARWIEPISPNYRGYDVWEIPPSGRGLIVLMALNILKGLEFGEYDCAQTWYRQLEATKLACVDGLHYISQPQSMRVSVEELLHVDYAASRHALIGGRAFDPSPGQPKPDGTVYLVCGDEEGNLVSFIQSNYHGFGSGVVVPGAGIALQNRGAEFSLDPDHMNYLESDKQTPHTIISGFLSKNSMPFGPSGVMGAYTQPQGHVQIVMNPMDFDLNPQTALDAPYWQWLGGLRIGIERVAPRALAAELARRGHQMEIVYDSISYGRDQTILHDSTSGIPCGDTEPRADPQIAVW